jgi:hypothetical protein
LPKASLKNSFENLMISLVLFLKALDDVVEAEPGAVLFRDLRDRHASVLRLFRRIGPPA